MADNYDTSREAFHVMTDAGADCADLYYANRVASLTLLALLWHRYSHVVPLTEIDQVVPLACSYCTALIALHSCLLAKLSLKSHDCTALIEKL